VSSPVAVPDGAALRSSVVSGRVVVFCMFLLGAAATVTMYVYWEANTRPFRPLTEAVGREFRHSLPKVEGGRGKKGPWTLRISLRVPFAPNAASPDAQRVVNRVVELARRHADLSQYERFEVHLFEMRPQEEAVRQSFEFAAADVAARLPFEEAVKQATPNHR
jgi:hypothetical protein